MMKLLNKAAVTCRPCPTNAELAVALGLKNAEVARYEFNRLVRQGKIAVAGFGPRRRRVVTIVATGQQTRKGGLLPCRPSTNRRLAKCCWSCPASIGCCPKRTLPARPGRSTWPCPFAHMLNLLRRPLHRFSTPCH